MTKGIYSLFADNKPLPPGTLIRETAGGVNTGQWHVLPEHMRKIANRCPNSLSQHVPYWVVGWKDLLNALALPSDFPATGKSLHSSKAPERAVVVGTIDTETARQMSGRPAVKTCKLHLNEP